jgi:hypothetical protein
MPKKNTKCIVAFTVYMLIDFGCWVCCLQFGGVVVVVGFWMVEWIVGVEK